MSIKLVIAEKPSVGKTLAAVLGADTRKDGYYEGGGYVVSWCLGHLVGLAPAKAYDERYKTWRYGDLPILPDQWQYTADENRRKQLCTLYDLMDRQDVDTVVNACDAGREGQLIFRLVYDYCSCDKPVERLWISSMEDTAIREGFSALRPAADFDALGEAARCRAQADWLVGINMSRLFSVLYKQSLTVGRVQTPTLAILVQRAQAIRAFKPEPFYTVELHMNTFTALGERHRGREDAEGIRAACDGGTAVIREVTSQEKTAAPPKLYDLTTLQRVANRQFGYTAKETLDYAQSLYEQKRITYPRTDSRFITADMAAGIPALVALAAERLHIPSPESVATERIVKDTGVTDHHALLPTAAIGETDMDALPTGERSILELIARGLVCAVSEPHIYRETVITVDCGEHSFTTKGKTTVQAGWKAFAPAPSKDKDEGAEPLPELEQGQTIAPVSASVKEGATQPPKAYTEDTLLSAMERAGAADMPEDCERKGLGTPATRAGMIERLVKSELIRREKKQLLPTEKGETLIAVLPEVITSPQLTAQWEQRLQDIESGAVAPEAFMASIEAFTRELVESHTAPDPEHLARFPANGDQGEPVGTCPRCGKLVYEGKKGFFCHDRACGFVLWKNNRFFLAKKKNLTRAVASALLKEGRVTLKGCHSEKTGKTYDAVAILNDTGGKFVDFKLEFLNPKKKKQ